MTLFRRFFSADRTTPSTKIAAVARRSPTAGSTNSKFALGPELLIRRVVNDLCVVEVRQLSAENDAACGGVQRLVSQFGKVRHMEHSPPQSEAAVPPREDAALEPAMLGDLPATRGLNQLSDAERQQLATSNQPAQVGRYRLLDKLGEGGFGTVYLADDPQLQRRVAIKVPRSDKKWKPEQLEEYRREAQVLAKFEHENIVRVYDIGQDDLFPVFIVSQFIDGISLSKIVHGFHKDKKYRYVARVIQILAMSLKYAHEQGVVHRDLKPANVMLRHGDFQVFLMDFGLALRDEDNAAGQVCGTPGYASPEQVSGEGHRIDGRSDLYSLGAMLHEMLTGRVPFATKPEHQGDGWAAWTSYRERVRHSDVRPPRQLDQNIPRELERICLKLLERRASDRYSCAADLIEDLTAYIAGVPLTMVGGSDAESVQSVASELPLHVAGVPGGKQQIARLCTQVEISGLHFGECQAQVFRELLRTIHGRHLVVGRCVVSDSRRIRRRRSATEKAE